MIEQITSGIARSHPILMLGQLKAATETGRSLPPEIEGIGAAFDQNALELTRWLIDEVSCEANTGTAVMRLAMADGMTQSQADHLASEVSDLTANRLVALASALRAVNTWPVSRPDLARQMLVLSRGSSHHAAVRGHIADAMWPAHWSFENGTSPELARVRSRAVQALANEHDEELKAEFDKLANALQAEMSRLASRHEERMNS